jgi:hypothetical protein
MMVLIIIKGKVVFGSRHHAVKAYMERGGKGSRLWGSIPSRHWAAVYMYPTAGVVVVAAARSKLTARGGN